MSRDALVDLLVAHQRHMGGCLCGWHDLGKSHAEHVAKVLRGQGAVVEGVEMQLAAKDSAIAALERKLARQVTGALGLRREIDRLAGELRIAKAGQS